MVEILTTLLWRLAVGRIQLFIDPYLMCAFLAAVFVFVVTYRQLSVSRESIIEKSTEGSLLGHTPKSPLSSW